MIIDSHQHFWKLERGDYDWLSEELAPIFRDFLPPDLNPLMQQTGVEGTILVQATDTQAETEYLLDLAEKTSWVLGVVGWVDMVSPSAPDIIGQFAKHHKFVGIRPMIQGIADEEWMLKPELEPAYQALINLNLAFDALVLPCHLRPLKQLLKRHPEMKVIIDHGAKPEIRNGAWQPWADEMAEIASTSNACCKLSGLVTEAADGWKKEDVKPYANHILSEFGPDRTIFGSDWPVLNLAGNYQGWIELVKQWVPEEHHTKVFRENAKGFYLAR